MRYWLTQIGVWGGYCVVYYVAILLPFRQGGLKSGAADLLYCLVGLAGTDFLRRRMERSGWAGLPARQLLWRVALGSVAVGVALSVTLEGALVAIGAMSWRDYATSLPVLASVLFWSCFLIALWLAVYLTIAAGKRRRAAELEALRARLAARDSQWRGLQAQLNPHFLFNSLNSLRALIGEDPPRAQTMVTRLAELLRYTLRADRSPAVTLREELATVADYLELEGIRYEERLRARWSIAPQALEAAVPPLLVQGLVENALKHGIARLPRGGELGVAAKPEAGRLRIEVTNPGRLAAGGEGTGLANARERLRLLHGDGARLELTEYPAGIVRAIAEFPFAAPQAAPEAAPTAPPPPPAAPNPKAEARAQS